MIFKKLGENDGFYIFATALECSLVSERQEEEEEIQVTTDVLSVETFCLPPTNMESTGNHCGPRMTLLGCSWHQLQGFSYVRPTVSN